MSLPPVIAGGLIRTKSEVKEVLKSGALGISTSRKELWNLEISLTPRKESDPDMKKVD